MATHTPTMHRTAAEDPGTYTPTPVSAGFSALLVALSAMIEAERDIEDVDVFDPAFANWLRDAERAQDRVVDCLRMVREAELQRAEDRPLQRLAMLIDAVISSEEPGEFTRLHRLVPSHAALFRCAGNSAVARRVDHMLLAGLARIDDLAMLDTYANCPPHEDPDILPETIHTEVMTVS